MERIYEPGHPATVGHFPGNPIVPGALLLAAVLDAVGGGPAAALAPFQIRSAKFLSPARPGDRVVIRYSRTGGDASAGDFRFTCAVGERPVLTGQISCSVQQKAE